MGHDDHPSFEQTLQELEQIVNALEEGQLGLGEALAKYEEGVHCLKRCQATLESAERKIELLSGIDPQGSGITSPFDDATIPSSAPGSSADRPLVPSQPATPQDVKTGNSSDHEPSPVKRAEHDLDEEEDAQPGLF